MAEKNSQEIELNYTVSDDALGEITSFDDALALLTETYGEAGIVVASDVLGDGFAMLTNKDLLIGVTFVAVKWTITMGDHGEFAVVKLVTIDGKKYVVTDGSTGLHQQLSDFSAKTGRYGGLVVKNGLRKSDYTYTDENGKETPATTYYLDLTA
jgi:hypothetical protein